LVFPIDWSSLTFPRANSMPKQTPKKTNKATPKTTPRKVATKVSPGPKTAVTKTSPRTPKESPKVKEAKETLAKIASQSKSPKGATKGKVTPTTKKATPKTSKIPTLDLEAHTNNDTPRASPRGKVGSAKVTPKSKVAKVPSPKSKAATPKSGKTSPKAKPSPKPKVFEVESSDDEPLEFKAGELVDAQWDDGLFYSAKVVKVHKLKSGNAYDVEFTQDGIQVKKLKRDQIQSYSEESEGPSARSKAKVSIDDQEYVDGFVLIPEEDASVESDSADAPRRRGRAPKTAAPKRKRAPSESVSEKKRKVQTALGDLTQKQIVTVVTQACGSNPKLLDSVLQKIPEKKQVGRGRK